MIVGMLDYVLSPD